MWRGTGKGQGSARLTRASPGAWTLSSLAVTKWRRRPISLGSCPLSLGTSVLCVGTLASRLLAAGDVGFCRPFLRVPASAPEISPPNLHCSLAFSDLDASGGHFLGLGFSDQSVGSAAVAIVAPSLAQRSCKMSQLPPPCACPGLGEAPDPGARSQYLEGLG